MGNNGCKRVSCTLLLCDIHPCALPLRSVAFGWIGTQKMPGCRPPRQKKAERLRTLAWLHNMSTGGGLKPPRAPPGAVKTGPIAAACVVALAYYTYSVYRGGTTKQEDSTKTVPWWKPSN